MTETSGPDDSQDDLLRAIARAPARDPGRPPPARVAHFLLQAQLGRGGMGVVYRALDEKLGRTVALKLLPPALEADSERRMRLLREARAAASVSHPNIATIYEVGDSDGRSYIAMELVAGQSLRARMGIASLPVHDALAVALQIANALASAHEIGLVHRDLKPENVMVDDDGHVKVLDFGLAKVVQIDDGTPSALGRIDTVTQDGFILGTPAYMAPEQMRGEPVTPAADVFAFGVTLFEMVTGVRPSSSRSPTDRALPPTLEPFLARCLHPDASARFANGAALASALAEVRASLPTPGAQPREPQDAVSDAITRAPVDLPRRRKGALLTAVLVGGTLSCVALVLVASALRHRTPPMKLSGLIRLEGGDFTMGRTTAEIDRECQQLSTLCRRDALEREQPAHPVHIEPFYLDTDEATNAEVAAWLDAVSTDFRPDTVTNVPRYVVERGSGTLLVDTDLIYSGLSIQGRAVVVRPLFANKPVVQITWDGARSYCASRGKRLPTEAEWEFAARGRTARRFPWGDQEPTCAGVVVGRDEGLPCSALPSAISSVDDGAMDFTPEGVHGLGGSVSEWVEDAFTAYYADCGDCRNPVQAPINGAATDVRVIRGGAWSKYLFTHATARGRWNRDSVAGAIGARCAVSVSR